MTKYHPAVKWWRNRGYTQATISNDGRTNTINGTGGGVVIDITIADLRDLIHVDATQEEWLEFAKTFNIPLEFTAKFEEGELVLFVPLSNGKEFALQITNETCCGSYVIRLLSRFCTTYLLNNEPK